MRRTGSLLLMWAAGCGFSITAAGGGGDGGGDGDGGVEDGPSVDVPLDNCLAWQARHFDACAIPPPTGDVTLDQGSPLVFDTTTGTLTDASSNPIPIVAAEITQPGGVPAMVWSVINFQLRPGIELDVLGDKPLIIAAWGASAIDGRIDVGSHRNGRTGAGANPASCATRAAGAGLDGLSGTGGGGGGGFQGNGAAGGDGDGNCVGVSCYRTGGMRGTAVAAPADVIGGCNGNRSGRSTTVGAAGGAGGGALLLAVRGALVVNGVVVAGGAGGGGDVDTAFSYGGGGGGAGGFIGFEAATLDLAASTIAANGGAGGGGSNIAGTGGHGGDGADGATAATGGRGRCRRDRGRRGLVDGAARRQGQQQRDPSGGASRWRRGRRRGWRGLRPVLDRELHGGDRHALAAGAAGSVRI